MNIYAPQDFLTISEWARYLAGLRVPIPPIISTLEIWSYMSTGSTALVTTSLYRVSIVASYALALSLCSPSVSKVLLSFLASIPLMWGTAIVHAGNPQVYDAFYPFCILIFIALLSVVHRSVRLSSSAATICSITAGLVLALTELTRPFVLFLMPLLLAGGVLVIRPHGRTHIVAFLLPLLLISGTWHAYQLAEHGQLLWSNHVGFNLIRAWPRTSLPALTPEPASAPLGPDRWSNLNTPEHTHNSRLLEQAVLAELAKDPAYAARSALAKLLRFVSTPTQIYGHAPFEPFLIIYRAVSAALFIALFANALRLTVIAFGAPRSALQLLSEPQNVLLVVALLSLVILALGEAEEEARLVISVLPMLAVLPSATEATSLSARTTNRQNPDHSRFGRTE